MSLKRRENQLGMQFKHSLLKQVSDSKPVAYKVSVRTNDWTSKINLSIPSELSLIPDFQQQNVISKAKKPNLIAFSP